MWLTLRSRLGPTGTTIFVIALAAVVAIALAGAFADRITDVDPRAQSLRARYAPPSMESPFGRDALGRDVWARVLYGTRTSIGIAVAATIIATLLGSFIGFLAGFVRGAFDQIVVRIVDALIAFPLVLLAILMVAVMGSGIPNLVLAIVLASLPHYIRVARGTALALIHEEYLTAARALGATWWRQLWRHLLPNGVSVVVVLASARLGQVILTESALSFLGLGVPPGTPSWGSIISEGRGVLRDAPWVSLAPGLAIMVTVLAFNLLGDGVRDLMDPKRKGTGLRRLAGGP
jgi:peptide/nickel transport system permease protein